MEALKFVLSDCKSEVLSDCKSNLLVGLQVRPTCRTASPTYLSDCKSDLLVAQWSMG